MPRPGRRSTTISRRQHLPRRPRSARRRSPAGNAVAGGRPSRSDAPSRASPAAVKLEALIGAGTGRHPDGFLPCVPGMAACTAGSHALAPAPADVPAEPARMTYVVTENCIKCKYLDCVEVCPVDCFYEGENMLVIHPDECIDCGVCEPECPVDAIKPDTEPGLEKWLELNAEYSKPWANITVKK